MSREGWIFDGPRSVWKHLRGNDIEIKPLDEKSVVIDVRNDGPVRWVVPISVLRQVLGPAPSREEAHRDVIDSLRAMTSQEILASAIEAGIYDKDGNLTPEYGGEAAPLPSADRKGEP